MTIDEALTKLMAKGMTRSDAYAALDHMLIRVGYHTRALDRTISIARYMNTVELVRFFGLEGARAAIILSRK